MRVLILGCGPAGLMAAHAAASAGADVRILSKARKSFMRGAQYLHAPIPAASQSKPFRVTYDLAGTEAEYRAKVYGATWDGEVSPESLVGESDAWDIREAYDWLWDVYGEYVDDWEAYPASVRSALDQLKPDLTVSTIPAPLLCAEGHTFGSTDIWATNTAVYDIPDNTVLCNGHLIPGWYRVSKIQGWGNTEWSAMLAKPPISPMWKVPKPTKTNCDCWPQIVRAGRYGKWTKGVLSHSAYEEVLELCVTSMALS